MSQYFRIQITQAATSSTPAKSWVWSPDSEIVQSADIELRKEGKRVSTATIVIWDPRSNLQHWPIANALPDPAFLDIPLQIYLSKPAESQAASKLVFDGKLSSIQPSFPGPSNVTLVAHDRSVDARRQASYKTFKNMTSVQIANAVANLYGYIIDTSELGPISLNQRSIEIGAGGFGSGVLSDWNHIARALAVDGLEIYPAGNKTFKVRVSAQTVYPHTFKPDDGFVIEYRPTINHIGGPGQGGQAKNPVPAGNKGTVPSATGTVTQEASAEKADGVTHRVIPQGPSTKNTGAHTESIGANVGPAVQHRKRKDEATLTVWALPDIGLQHIIPTQGWGGKFDHNWHLQSIKHSIAGRNPATTTMSLTSEPSGAAKNQIGILPAASIT